MSPAPATRAPPRRLAIVVSHPTQYYAPWFRWLAAHSRIEGRVFYLWDYGVAARRDPRFGTNVQWDVDLLSGYAHEFVPNVARVPGAESFWGFNNPRLSARLADWRPEALLLFGYAWASHLRAAAWAWRTGVPVIFRGDSHFLGRNPRSLRRLPLRLLFRQFRAFACVGRANRDYFHALGVPASRLFFAPHAVDHTLFDPADAAHTAAARRLRTQLGLADSTRVILFAGKLVADKQPRHLLESFLALAPAGAALVFVGEGAEKPALQARAAAPGAPPVFFLPFANQSEMPARYLLADVVVLPSRTTFESWGLVVNEAMHLGRPCIVSDRVGCQADLVTPGETGWVFAHDDPAGLQASLRAALAADLAPYRAAALRRIAGYTYAQTTAGLEAALASCG